MKFESADLSCECHMKETCGQCNVAWSPSLVESGWCIFCILKDVKKQKNMAQTQAAMLANALRGLVDHDFGSLTIAQNVLKNYNYFSGQQ